MTGPKIHPRRDENEPIDSVSPTGHGSARVGRTIMELLLDEATLMIVRAANGEIFALDPTGLRAQSIANLHPDWITGTYTRRCGVGAIAGDLVVQCREVRRLAA